MDASGDRPTVAVLTDLWPSRSQPQSGAFVRAQVAALALAYRHLVLVPKLLAPRLHWRIWGEAVNGWQVGHFPVEPPGRVLRYASLRVPKIGEAEVRSACARVVLAVARERPVLVHGHFLHEVGLAAVRLGRTLGVPSVVTVHGTDGRWLLEGGVPPRFRRRMLEAARAADRVIAVSNSLAAGLVRVGVPNERIAVIPMGVDADLFRLRDRATVRAAVGVEPRSRIVLFVGTATLAKGFRVLEEALGSIPGVDCYAAGPAPLASDRIRPLGTLPPARLAEWAAAADVLCLPSFAEGTPVAVAEALAAGTPVVATDVGGIPEQIAPGRNGLLVPAGDPAALAAALEAALEREWQPEDIRATSERFWWTTIAARIEGLYAELLA